MLSLMQGSSTLYQGLLQYDIEKLIFNWDQIWRWRSTQFQLNNKPIQHLLTLSSRIMNHHNVIPLFPYTQELGSIFGDQRCTHNGEDRYAQCRAVAYVTTSDSWYGKKTDRVRLLFSTDLRLLVN